MVRYGRQTVSVDVDTGVLLFDRKGGSYGVERIPHDRSKKNMYAIAPATFLFLENMYSTKLCLLGYLLCVSPSDCQVPEQSCEGTHGYWQPPQHTTGDDVWECTGKKALSLTRIHCFLSHSSLSDSHAFQKRDAFCQLLQLMKTRHSQLSEPDMISVFVGTWNMGEQSLTYWSPELKGKGFFFKNNLLCCFVLTGGSPPPRSLQTWVTCCGLGHTPDESTALLPHDIYALGTQENPQGEKEWIEHIKATLRSYTHIDFKQVILLNFFQLVFLCLNWVHYPQCYRIDSTHQRLLSFFWGSITAYLIKLFVP